uniref:Phosphatidylglycerol--prolipoprotein diacylglyceryl transferase n=1 Tax=uncultured candidate division WWE3 bacterium EJ0ADIGA11YD11 TaxID=500145 RepID=B0KVB9_UNCKA|nr:Prolipoprotein diacylglyceryl transferase [uncultured candidate division WWE3 bacterium EJ0ADIGA11YD11]
MLNLYGITISLSIFLCILITQKLVVKYKKNEEIFWGLSFWTILCGILGARIYHVLDYFDYYRYHQLDIFKIWNGGMGIWGGIFGGTLGAITYLKIKGEKIFPWLDIISVVTPLGQSVGRWGNFFNKEIFGLPTTLPWGIYIEPEKRPVEFLNYSKFHPLFVYESILNFILFLFLLILYKKTNEKTPSGTFLCIYLISYSTIRFFLEFLRTNPWKIEIASLFLNVSQCISILVIIISIIFIFRNNFLRKKQ